MITKELTNDQRARLEQIARDEFNIKQREISKNKSDKLSTWITGEVNKAKASADAKKYAKLFKEMEAIRLKFHKAGFSIGCNKDASVTMAMLTSTSYDYDRNLSSVHPLYNQKYRESKVDIDSFTRALNKVLSVIWSMEKPFSECIKLIESEVKKIK